MNTDAAQFHGFLVRVVIAKIADKLSKVINLQINLNVFRKFMR